MKNKTPWINSGRFEPKTCKQIQAYIAHKTGKEAQVHKANRYLVITWSDGDSLKVHQINNAPFLYTMEEKEFDQLFEKMGNKTPLEVTTEK